MRLFLNLVVFSLLGTSSYGQTTYTINGSVQDSVSGEELIGATIYVDQIEGGTVTNVYGFYSLSLPPTRYDMTISYVGYEQKKISVDLDQDLRLDLALTSNSSTLKEFEVTAEKRNQNVTQVQMSSEHLTIEQIKGIPSFMGEVDIIKAIQLLPGVQTVGEGSTGMYVRGGGADQNLVLLDESPVYNASHLLGIFSVFNPDVIKDVQLYKGGIPAQYGGRLASVLDIRMRDGHAKKFHGSGGIGTVSSRLTLEGPIVKDKSSFLISGRRTYADLFLKFSSDPDMRSNQLYFYDLNAKLNYRLGQNDRIFLSGYFGRDVLDDSGFKISWGNTTGTARWNHIFGKKLFSNVSLIYSDFDYFLGEDEGNQAFSWKSNIRNASAKFDLNLFANPNNTIRFGYQLIHHTFAPGDIRSESDESIVFGLTLEKKYALEHGLYLSNEQKISPRISAEYGIRWSGFQNVGKATEHLYDEMHEVTDTVLHASGEFYNFFHGLEPRIGVRYGLSPASSIKASYNRTRQYVQLASNGTSTSPFDIWFPASPRVTPQISDQIALGYFHNFKEDLIETSAEIYYKEMQNTIDFKDHAQLLFNEFLEGELRFGSATAYGLELSIKKNRGRFTGFINYTLSKVEKDIDEINEGDPYLAHYDQTHNLAIVASYELNDRWKIAANWIYQSGRAVTLPTGRFEYGGTVVPVYSDRNDARMPSYHRLDFSATLQGKKNADRKWQGEWVFSIYNAYARKNAFSINFRQEENDPTTTYAEKTYLFTIIPSITYNFSF